MATGRDVDVKWALNPNAKAQSAYGTVLDDGDLSANWPFKGPDLAVEKIDFKDDLAEFGKGHEFATRQDEETRDLDLTRKMDLTSALAGWAGALGLGDVVTTLLTAGAYQHVMRMSDPETDALQHPVTSIIERDGVGQQQKIRDILVDSIKLTGKIKERVACDIGFVTAGHRADNSAAIARTSVGTFLRFSRAQIQFGVAGNLVDVSKRCSDFEIDLNNQTDKDGGYAAGCADADGKCYRVQALYGARTVSANFTIKQDAAVELGLYRGNTLAQLIITLTGDEIGSTGHDHSHIIALKNVKIKTLTKSFNKNLAYVKIECLPIWDEVNDVGTPVQSVGTGLSDLTVTGVQAAGEAEIEVLVKITTAGATDKYDWSLDAGDTWEETAVSIVAKTPHPLGETGLSLAFNAATAHVEGDEWTITTKSRQGPILWTVVNNIAWYLTEPTP